MKNDKFQENLSRPGIIDAKARRFRNTALSNTAGRVVSLSDNYRYPLPVGSFTALT